MCHFCMFIFLLAEFVLDAGGGLYVATQELNSQAKCAESVPHKGAIPEARF